MTTKTRREKIAAIAETAGYNPEEAAVAQAMLDRMPSTLDDIAAQIKVQWGLGVEAEFAVGRLLSQARALFPGKQNDKAFGAWFAQQEFPFGQQKAHRLRWGAEHEAEVRALIASQSSSSAIRDIGVTTAVQYLNAKPKAPTADVGPTTVADPAYAALREAARLILGSPEEPKNAFLTMHVDDLASSAGWIKDLAGAYNVAKAERQAK